MKIKFKGRLIKEGTEWEAECDSIKDNYSVGQRDISVVICINGNYYASLKEHFETEVIA